MEHEEATARERVAPTGVGADPKAEVLDAIRRLRRLGEELVGLLELRRDLAHMSREVLDRTLLALERGYLVDLKLANNPRRLLPEVRQAAIEVEGRGVLCWVLERQQTPAPVTFVAPVNRRVWRQERARLRREEVVHHHPLPLGVETPMERAALVVTWDHGLEVDERAGLALEQPEGRAALISCWSVHYALWGNGYVGPSDAELVEEAATMIGIDRQQVQQRLARGWSPHVIGTLLHGLWYAREVFDHDATDGWQRPRLDLTDRLYLATDSMEPSSLEELARRVIGARWPTGFEQQKAVMRRFLTAQGDVLDAYSFVLALRHVQAGDDPDTGAPIGTDGRPEA